MVLGAVRRRVAWTKKRRERLASHIGDAEHRVKTEPELVVGRGSFFVLGVDVDQRGVDVEHHRVLALYESGPAPHRLAHLGETGLQIGDDRLVEILGEGPIKRRVRAHVGEQVVFDS